MQAVEAIKLLSGVGDPMSRRLLLVDTLSARFHVVKLRGRCARRKREGEFSVSFPLA